MPNICERIGLIRMNAQGIQHLCMSTWSKMAKRKIVRRLPGNSAVFYGFPDDFKETPCHMFCKICLHTVRMSNLKVHQLRIQIFQAKGINGASARHVNLVGHFIIDDDDYPQQVVSWVWTAQDHGTATG